MSKEMDELAAMAARMIMKEREDKRASADRYACFEDTGRRRISVSAANLALRCPLGYKFEKELKLEVTPSRILAMGRYFDALFSKNASERVEYRKQLTQEEISVVYDRWMRYEPVMPPGRIQHHIQWQLNSDWDVIGFIDLVPDPWFEQGVGPIIDVKFSEKPWDGKKADRDDNVRQRAVYCIGMAEELKKKFGFDVAPTVNFFQYHVLNTKNDKLQKLTQIVTPWQFEATREDMEMAARVIESGEREPTINHLCDWCSFMDRCPAQDPRIKKGQEVVV